MANIFTATGAINKNLIKFARSLNLEIYVHEDDRLVTLSEIDEDGEPECEWLFSYQANEAGELFYNGNVYFPKSAKEELPNWIADAAKLKEVIKFTADTMKAA